MPESSRMPGTSRKKLHRPVPDAGSSDLQADDLSTRPPVPGPVRGSKPSPFHNCQLIAFRGCRRHAVTAHLYPPPTLRRVLSGGYT